MARTRVARAVREELMLEAAEEVFGAAGYRGASMDAIAERSGITKAMLYQYFASKDALYDACTERMRSRLFDSLEERLHDVAGGAERMRLFIDTYFAFLAEHRGKPWLLYAEASVGTANAMRELNADAVVRMLRETLGARTPVDETDLELVAHALVGAGEQVGRWWLARDDVEQDDAAARFTQVAGAITATVLR
ncbi:MAG TPA: TetR/AcrR family transcriptional regulator [Solirubrobacteraceae bacterium]